MIPIVYSKTRTVAEADLDELQHVNNVVYLNYLQSIAIEHWYGSVPKTISDPVRWVVRNHNITYLKPAIKNDVLHLKTWISGFEGISCYRSYEIYNAQNQLLITATTHWVAVNPTSHKPQRLDLEQIKPYFFQ